MVCSGWRESGKRRLYDFDGDIIYYIYYIYIYKQGVVVGDRGSIGYCVDHGDEFVYVHSTYGYYIRSCLLLLNDMALKYTHTHTHT